MSASLSVTCRYCIGWTVRANLWLQPAVNTSNNVEATLSNATSLTILSTMSNVALTLLPFLAAMLPVSATMSNEISSFRQSRSKLNMFDLFRLCRKDSILRYSIDIVAVCGNKVACCFDKVERSFDNVTAVDGALEATIVLSYIVLQEIRISRPMQCMRCVLKMSLDVAWKRYWLDYFRSSSRKKVKKFILRLRHKRLSTWTKFKQNQYHSCAFSEINRDDVASMKLRAYCQKIWQARYMHVLSVTHDQRPPKNQMVHR